MGKLEDKKEKVVNVLKTLLEKEYRFNKREDELVRIHLNKLKKYNKAKKRHPDKMKTNYDKEIRYFEDLYLNNIETDYERLRKEINLDAHFEYIIKNRRALLLEQGLEGFLHSIGIAKEIYRSVLEMGIPEHPKDEHPETRVMNRKFLIHAGPTNSGKTYESIEKLKRAENGMFLAPLRLLALEIYEKLNLDGVPCDLRTGEEHIEIPFSKHYSSTIEKTDFDNEYDIVVIDEGQLISDDQRGNAWLRAILGVKAKEIHICCSLNAVDLITTVIKECGDAFEVIEHHRNTPLIVEEKEIDYPNGLEKGDALISFSRKKVLAVASELNMRGIKTSVIYGNLPPETRRKQVELFATGETEVVIATDSIGMGLNLPIRRVIFLEQEKYDGEKRRPLLSQEIKQIAGRAGRQGLFPEGYVTAKSSLDFIGKNLKQKDHSYDKASIKPLEETILNLPFGGLKEKLMHWLEFDYNINYIKKANIDEQLELLDKIPEKVARKLTEVEMYRAIHVPFDTKNEELSDVWLDYVRVIANRNDQLQAPKISLDLDLEDLETLYRKLDLYYSFSKAFNSSFDESWVNEQRHFVADEIMNRLLA